ncbi:MAG: C4-dicarboxylate transporter permease [Herminiimonas sp.]|nr:C4-dicarboxylate transporter permease [Herminiimonas sp.]
MRTFVPRLEGLVEWLMAIALAVMMVLVFSNVVLRYGFGSGIAWAEELSRLMFVWLIFLGAILALRRHAHLGMELIQARLPRWARRSCAVLSHLLMLYGLWLFFVGSWAQTLIGLSTYSTVMRYPTAFMASAGLLCSASMMLVLMANLWAIVTGNPNAMVPGEVRPDAATPPNPTTTFASAE